MPLYTAQPFNTSSIFAKEDSLRQPIIFGDLGPFPNIKHIIYLFICQLPLVEVEVCKNSLLRDTFRDDAVASLEAPFDTVNFISFKDRFLFLDTGILTGSAVVFSCASRRFSTRLCPRIDQTCPILVENKPCSGCCFGSSIGEALARASKDEAAIVSIVVERKWIVESTSI